MPLKPLPQKCLMVWDQYKTHVNAAPSLMNKFGLETLLIPAKLTHLLQPLDVGINGPFKKLLRDEWDFWYKNGEKGQKYYTKKGRRQKPSYQCLVDMVSRSTKKIGSNLIIKSFQACGLTPNGADYDPNKLHSALKTALNPPFTDILADENVESDTSDEEMIIYFNDDSENK